MIVIVAERQLALMFFGRGWRCRITVRRADVIAGLRRAAFRRWGLCIWLQHGLRRVEVAAQIVLEIIEGEALTQIVARSPKLAHASAQHAREFGQTLGPEDEERHDQDQSEFLNTDSKHVLES